MTPAVEPSRPVSFGPGGLVPAVIQDDADGRVLMVAYMDAEALAATIATGEVHFHSRSRDRLWRKGETSGNEYRIVKKSGEIRWVHIYRQPVWDEAQKIQQNPGTRDATIARKQVEWTKVAEQIKAEDPQASVRSRPRCPRAEGSWRLGTCRIQLVYQVRIGNPRSCRQLKRAPPDVAKC
jgi:hypothetical protein